MNSSPITTRWISVPATSTSGDPPSSFDAYLCTPPAGRGPGLLLLQEIFGVNEHIRGVAEQYALAGFTVLAPDLFWRQTRRVELGYVGEEREQAMALMRSVQREQVVADMQASLALLRTLPELGDPSSAGIGESAANGARIGESASNGARIGAVGYCMGGRLAFTAAALCGVDAAVAYYGGGIAGQLDLAAQISCPVQFHHAGQDHAIPPEAVAVVKAAMAASPAAGLAEFHDYPQAQHGFNCWARAAYHPASAALALGRSLGFLAQLFKTA
ncbi:MAG: hypothetical protein RIQ60_330 [Pseudomonadota bacterium]|jgi:carboxymethylenebutenolidase